MSEGMISFAPTKHEIFNYEHHEHPSVVQWKADDAIYAGDEKSTSYFFVTKGSVDATIDGVTMTFKEGWYGSIVGSTKLSGSGHALVSTRLEYTGMNQFGGPIERLGRLTYIDGCSSTLLLSAIKLGDPCFNFLHVPKNIDQTAHTHPTVRVGFIVSGHGIVKLEDEVLQLQPGAMFCLLPDVLHSFHTTDSELRIVIYHPDSDFGPSDQEHPMLNRTIIEGISARDLKRA